QVLDYHRSSKHVRELIARQPHHLDPANRPCSYRIFDAAPKVALPTNLMDCSAALLELSALGLEALPDSYVRPPQNLKTLASWLFYAAGVTKSVQVEQGTQRFRSNP